MRRVLIGWSLVVVQALLLVGLVVLPSRNDWPTPRWLHLFGTGFVVLGVIVVIVASLNLGRSLTPTPVPSSGGSLRTDGLFRFVRHPIYTGVLLIVVGLVGASGSLPSLALGAATAAFFTFKAKWEETLLAERFPEYHAFAAATPRFIPRPWNRQPSRPHVP